MPNQYTSAKAKAAKRKERSRAKQTKPASPEPKAPDTILNVGLHHRFLSPEQIKLLDGKPINPCTDKALKEGLPHFTLLPGDNFTPILLKHWIALAVQYGVGEDKLHDARGLLKRIEEWRTANPTRCKIPN